jgi:ubiquinol-cytochrome c reductase cytochrome c1 subunit
MKSKLILLLFALLPATGLASGPAVHLDRAPVNVNDRVSLQKGARLFVNYCLNCHSANYMRYSRLTDLGLTEQQIADNLLFTQEKVGQPMTIALRPADGKAWFGATPPDLTVIARSRDPDWLYTYLRSFYRDPSRPTGWNNTVFPNVGMPHVLWELQGEQVAHFKTVKDHEGKEKQVFDHFELVKPGKLTRAEYDAAVGDLVNYLVYMGEPAQAQRKQLGIIVIFFLLGLAVLTYYLKKEYWKDVH